MTPKTFRVSTQWSVTEDCILTLDEYADNRHVAISIWSLSEGPFAHITVNLPSTDRFPANYGYVDTNNFPEAEKVIADLGIGKPVGQYDVSGFCFYPLYEFDLEAIRKFVVQSYEIGG